MRKRRRMDTPITPSSAHTYAPPRTHPPQTEARAPAPIEHHDAGRSRRKRTTSAAVPRGRPRRLGPGAAAVVGRAFPGAAAAAAAGAGAGAAAAAGGAGPAGASDAAQAPSGWGGVFMVTLVWLNRSWIGLNSSKGWSPVRPGPARHKTHMQVGWAPHGIVIDNPIHIHTARPFSPSSMTSRWRGCCRATGAGSAGTGAGAGGPPTARPSCSVSLDRRAEVTMIGESESDSS